MIRTATCAAAILCLAVAAPAQRRSTSPAPENAPNPTLPKTESEKRILSTISDAVKARELYANVPAADGRLLRLLAEAVNAKSVIEIGTSTGISGMWFAMALERTGGHLTTFELDPARATLPDGGRSPSGHHRRGGRPSEYRQT